MQALYHGSKANLMALFLAVVALQASQAPVARSAPQAIQLSNTGNPDAGWVEVLDKPAFHQQHFTVELWVKPTGAGFGNTQDAAGATLFAKPDQGGVGGGPLSYHMGWCPTTQKLDFLLTNTPPNVYVNFTSNGQAALNSWTHVAFAFDGDTMRIFINGVKDAQTPYPYPSVYFGTESILIGAGNYQLPFLRRFQGDIDDVRLWNYSRTAAQIANQMSCSLSGSEPGLVGYWKMDGDLTDASPSHANGSAVGTVAFVSAGEALSACAATGVPADPRVGSGLQAGNAFPQPARQRVAVQYSIAGPGEVRAQVLDLSGRVVRRDVWTRSAPGSYQWQWDGTSDRGLRVPSGLYFVDLSWGNTHARRRVILTR